MVPKYVYGIKDELDKSIFDEWAIYGLFLKSLISGEFIEINITTIDDIRTQLSEKITSLKRTDIPSLRTLGRYYKALALYENLIKRYEALANVDETVPYFSEFPFYLLDEIEKTLFEFNTYPRGVEPDNPYANNFYRLIVYNFCLIEIDLMLDCSREKVRSLKRIIDLIKNEPKAKILGDSDYYYKITLEKAEYLFWKIEVRKVKQGDLEPDYSNLLNFGDSSFKGFYIDTKLHYIDKYENKEEQIRKLFYLNGNDSIKEIHSWNKIIKPKRGKSGSISVKIYDSSKLKSVLDNICNEKRKHNSLSFKSTCNLLNARKIEYELIEGSDSENGYQKIFGKPDIEKELFYKVLFSLESSQSNNQFKNFYGYKCFLEFVYGYIEFLRDNPTKLLPVGWEQLNKDNNLEREMEKIEARLNEIKKIYFRAHEEMMECIEWAQSWSYKPIYMDKKESVRVFEDGDFSLDLFLQSSYILPIYYEQLRNNWSDSKNRVNANIRSLKNRTRVEFQTGVFEGTFKKELDSRDFKAVTVLALFITVASFILGSVKIMSETKSGSKQLIVTFGLCLLIFNLVIYWISNREQWKVKDLRNPGTFIGNISLRSLALIVLITLLILLAYFNEIRAFL